MGVVCGASYPTRVLCQFQGRDGQIVLDQISPDEQKAVLDTLAEMFAE